MQTILDLPLLGQEAGAPFPPTSEALERPNGLLAWGGDLHPGRLLNAYRSGIFPWYSEGQPLLWWSPAPRCVLFPDEVYLSKRTRRRFNSGVFQLSCDHAFAKVMDGCAGPRRDDDGTWITPEMLDAYIALHRLGYAHSVEVWEGDTLAGGIYGLAIGSMFFGESMFSCRTDASKVALIALCRHLSSNGYGLLDCQVGNPHLFRMGAVEMPRTAFEGLLRGLTEDERTACSWEHEFVAEARW